MLAQDAFVQARLKELDPCTIWKLSVPKGRSFLLSSFLFFKKLTITKHFSLLKSVHLADFLYTGIFFL